MLDSYLALDRYKEAHETADRVQAQGIDGPRIHQRLLELAYAEDDKAASARQIQWFAGKPEEYLSLGLQAANLNVHGRRNESHGQYQRAAEAAGRLGFRYVADELQDSDALADALYGPCQTPAKLGRPALALALCGDTARAERLAAETSNAFPRGTTWNAVQLPQIQAAMALRHKDPARSLDLLASAAPYERAYPGAIYLRGMAYLQLHRGRDAAAEFRKVTEHKGASWGPTWVHPNWGLYYGPSCLGLARAYSMAGDSSKAIASYENVLALWHDADQDTPLVIQARHEATALNARLHP